MNSNELFSGFLNQKEEVEQIKIKVEKKRGKKPGVNYKLKYSNNYRKRVKMDKRENGLHHKLLKYDKNLNHSLKAMLKKQWVKDLGIVTINEMFIFAVTRGFINEEFKHE